MTQHISRKVTQLRSDGERNEAMKLDDIDERLFLWVDGDSNLHLTTTPPQGTTPTQTTQAAARRTNAEPRELHPHLRRAHAS